ncbi:MAG: hypothetical protein EHM91_14855 [Planctomycetota bacterium]|nr:MAG: hypothetical protein EHM91_14855 [Planctomycetota bacterium]
MVKTLDIPLGWKEPTVVWLNAWMPNTDGEVGSVSPHNWERIQAAVRPGNHLEISCRRMAMSDLAIITYRMNGPADSRFFFSSNDALQQAGLIASILIPLIAGIIIAAEQEAQRRRVRVE